MNARIVMSRRRVVNDRVVNHLDVTVYKCFHRKITIISIMVLRRFLLPFSFITAAAAAALKSPSLLSSAVKTPRGMCSCSSGFVDLHYSTFVFTCNGDDSRAHYVFGFGIKWLTWSLLGVVALMIMIRIVVMMVWFLELLFHVRNVTEEVGESKERVLSVMALSEKSLIQVLLTESNELDSVVKLAFAVMVAAACMTTWVVVVAAMETQPLVGSVVTCGGSAVNDMETALEEVEVEGEDADVEEKEVVADVEVTVVLPAF
ncbi:hypothetical protein HID58_057987 [Brassica napus]|uniref:Transmembrane protein n=1 Tax=Brassica napus TaxID=3708 RepID=A0ABQ7ZNZ9_BRANA|nr:hypothetical protein HID58_057987 [Brassica napus]